MSEELAQAQGCRGRSARSSQRCSRTPGGASLPSCPRRKEHRDYLHRIDRLEKERRALEEVLAREAEAEESRIRGVIRGIREVLNRFGYLYRGYPTAKADMLADIFDNDGLILCEMVDRGCLTGWLRRIWPRFSPGSASIATSGTRTTSRFRSTRPSAPPSRRPGARRARRRAGQRALHLRRAQRNVLRRRPRLVPRSTMVEIGEVIELSEGDLVLTFNKTIDLMRQVREMLADVMPEHALRWTLQQASG